MGSGRWPSKDFGSICLLLVLYTLQGIPMGLDGSLPLLLLNKISYKQQSALSLTSLPFRYPIFIAAAAVAAAAAAAVAVVVAAAAAAGGARTAAAAAAAAGGATARDWPCMHVSERGDTGPRRGAPSSIRSSRLWSLSAAAAVAAAAAVVAAA
ncbi:hypothetical protein ACSSS7_006609 [Eimeria intestinalis]